MPRTRTPDPEYVRALERVEQATRKLREAEQDVEAARDDLRHALADAYRLGVTLTVLGRIVGVSRQRVSAMIQR